MKLVTFQQNELSHAGCLLNDQVLHLPKALTAYEIAQGREATALAVRERYGEGVLGLLQQSARALPAVRDLCEQATAGTLAPSLLVPLADVQLLAPVPRPPSLRDGYAFRQHVETARRNRGLPMLAEFDQFPVFYFSNHHAITGPGDVRVGALQRERLDYELEVAVVVGKEIRNATLAEADAAIAGLTIMNDWSARTVQMEEMKMSLGPAKGKDFATSIGPWLVTVDELASSCRPSEQGTIYNLTMRAWVNETLLSEGNLAAMTWTFAQILARASDGATLYPGDVIGSGTVGTGCFLELNGSGSTQNQWLQPGDRVTLEVEGLGRLENRIVIELRCPTASWFSRTK